MTIVHPVRPRLDPIALAANPFLNPALNSGYNAQQLAEVRGATQRLQRTAIGGGKRLQLMLYWPHISILVMFSLNRSTFINIFLTLNRSTFINIFLTQYCHGQRVLLAVVVR